MADTLATAIADLPSLRACLVITANGDLFGSWIRDQIEWDVSAAAGFLDDLMRSIHRGLGTIGASQKGTRVVIDNAEARILVEEAPDRFVCCAVFERAAEETLKAQLETMMSRISALLPQVSLEQRPRGARLIAFLERYAPDPHAVLLRLSTRTGIPVETLQNDAASLDDGQVTEVEQAAKRILGLDHINI